MKPIDQMTLAEATSTVRNISQYANTDPFVDANGRPWVYDALHELADRIHDLTRLTRWIPVSEGYPNEGETVLCRRVEGGMGGSKEINPQVGTFRNGSFDCVFDWTRVTHWQRITPPEDKP